MTGGPKGFHIRRDIDVSLSSDLLTVSLRAVSVKNGRRHRHAFVKLVNMRSAGRVVRR